MTDNEEVVQEQSSSNVYSTKLSDFFYNKLNGIDNISDLSDEAELIGEDIDEDYGLEEANGKVDISTTKKLINYLKTLILLNVKKLNLKIDEKLDASDYVVDNELKSNSDNPVANSVIYNSLNNKSNTNHIHNMSDISSLDTSLNSKASATDLNSHINNKSNPHSVTLSQLGIIDTGWDSIPITQSSLSASDYPYCRKIGKLVVLSATLKTYKKFAKTTTFFTLKSAYRPNKAVFSSCYCGGELVALSIATDGRLYFGKDIPSGTSIRIHECYFTA